MNMKNKTKLMLGAIAACAICGVPLVLPFIVGFAGGGALVAGQWILGAVLAVGAAIFFARRKARGNSAKPQSVEGCCGAE